MPASFHHVHIKSRQPRRSASWWADMFDAEVGAELEFRDMLFIPVVLGGVQITLTGHREPEREAMGHPQPVPHFGLEHVGLLVDDLDEMLDRFREQDLPIYERRAGAGGFEIAFVESPDGVCLELLQKPAEG